MSIILFHLQELSEEYRQVALTTHGDRGDSALYSADGALCYISVASIPLDTTSISAFLARSWHSIVIPEMERNFKATPPPISVIGLSFRNSLDAILKIITDDKIDDQRISTNLCTVFIKRDNVRFSYVNKVFGGAYHFVIKRGAKSLTEEEVLNLFMFVVFYHTNKEDLQFGQYLKNWTFSRH